MRVENKPSLCHVHQVTVVREEMNTKVGQIDVKLDKLSSVSVHVHEDVMFVNIQCIGDYIQCWQAVQGHHDARVHVICYSFAKCCYTVTHDVVDSYGNSKGFF